MEEEQGQMHVKRSELITLCLAVLTVGGVMLSLWSCGDDLTFPGQVPPTSTAESTATTVPTETPDPNA